MIYDASVTTAEIASLLRPYIELEEKDLARIETYVTLLRKWNARISLTSVRDPHEIVRRHFGESFFAAAQLLTVEDALTVVDFGSGAGFPGIPMVMFGRHSRFTLIEANGKKAAFLNEAIRALGLGNARVFSGRAEDFGERADLVTMRAVEKFQESLPLAVTLAKPGGRVAIMIGAGQAESASAASLKLAWQPPIAIPGGHSRILLVGKREEHP